MPLNIIDYLKKKHIKRSLVLDASNGTRRIENITKKLLETESISVTFLELNAGRLEKVHGLNDKRVIPVNNKIEWYGIRSQFDIIYYDILPKDAPVFCEYILPCITELLNRNYILIINYPLITTTWDKLKKMPSFMVTIYENKTKNRKEIILFRHLIDVLSPEEITVLNTENTPSDGHQYLTVAVTGNIHRYRKLKKKTRNKLSYFDLDELSELLSELTRYVNYCSLEAYVAALKSDQNIGNIPHHCIKHDIHHDLLSAYRIAKVESSLNIPATFFIMHPHDINNNYILKEETIEILKYIQASGHEIGIHIDPMELEVAGNGLLPDLSDFLDYLRSRGIVIKIANTHGNTKYRHEASITGDIMFKEVAEYKNVNPLDYPDGYRTLIGRHSLREMSTHLNLTLFFDTVIYENGVAITADQMMLGDNYHKIDLYSLGKENNYISNVVFSSEEWNIDKQTRNKLAEKLRDSMCIYLIHPQFYR